MQFGASAVSQTIPDLPRRRLLSFCVLGTGALWSIVGEASAQTVDTRHWQGITAMTRQPEQVVAGTTAEWRSLWSRVGMTAPDVFEPGRMKPSAFSSVAAPARATAVNILSASRRRDRIVVVFEERMRRQS